MLVNCRLASLNYFIQRKTIVVVGRCITLPNYDLLAESNFWWYLQLISATLPAYRSTGTCCAPTTWSSHFSSFFNSTQVNDTLPSSSVGRLYRTYSTLLVSLGLTPWMNSLSWSLRPLNITSRHRTFNLWGSPPLNSSWTSIHPAIASNLHNKKLNTINEKLIQTFHQTLGVQIIHKP